MTAIAFEPIYQQRVWGGRGLETRFQRELPLPEKPFGESWEISAILQQKTPPIGGAFRGPGGCA